MSYFAVYGFFATFIPNKKRAEALFSKELMGKNLALLVMIDYDKRMIVVHCSYKEL
jgi:hypothetical protein